MRSISFAQTHNLRQCDAVITPKSGFNVVQHFVLYLGKNVQGTHLYIENNYRYGVRIITEKQFLADNPRFNAIRRFNGNDYQRAQAKDKAIAMRGTKYHLTNFNCEHFANYVQHNLPLSTQVDNTQSFIAIVGSSLLLAALLTAE